MLQFDLPDFNVYVLEEGNKLARISNRERKRSSTHKRGAGRIA